LKLTKIGLTALLWLASWVAIILLILGIFKLLNADLELFKAEAKSVNPIAYQEQVETSFVSTSSVKEYIYKEAVIYGVNPVLALCIVKNESQFNPTKLGPEKRGVSQGLWQIYSLAWPNITREEAFNIVWSTNWSLTQIKNGKIRWWSTYSKYCSSIPVLL
jgi:hypothetical protein